MGVAAPPEDEVERNFAQRLRRRFHIARISRRSAIDEIPQRVRLDSLEVPRAPEAGGVNGPQTRIALQLQERIVSQKSQLIIVAHAAGNFRLQGVEGVMIFLNQLAISLLI